MKTRYWFQQGLRVAAFLVVILLVAQPSLSKAQANAFVFTDSGQRLGNGSTWVVELADIDRDGDLDALVGNDYPENLEVWRNNGSGTFSDTGQRLGQIAVRDIGVGDFDGDNDLDLMIVNDSQFADTVYFNDGAGNFSLQQTLDADSSSAVEIGDLNGDGYLDAVILSYNQHKVWLSNRQGIFTATSQNLGGGNANDAGSDVKLGDLNNDGSLDMVIAASSTFSTNRVWFNNGSGMFTQGQAFGRGDVDQGIALADFDGDGYLDVFLKQIYLNNGSGAFTVNPTGPSIFLETPTDIDLADFDQDGDSDLLISTRTSIFAIQNNGIQNNGDTYFFLGAISTGNRAAVGDLNGDGTFDVFMPAGPNLPPGVAPNEIWFNQTPAAPPPAPAIWVSANRAKPGSQLLVQGMNLPDNAQLALSINGQQVHTGITTDNNGSLKVGFDTTGGQEGDYFVVLQQTGQYNRMAVGDRWSTFFTLATNADSYTLDEPELTVITLPTNVALDAKEQFVPVVLR